MRRRAVWSRALSALLLAAALAGCGYHVAGKGGVMPGGVTELAIPVFVNQTQKPNVESTITNAFVNEFLTTVSVVGSGDSVLEGRIRSYTLTPVSFSKSDVNQEYRLTVVIALVLRKGGKIVWKDDSITDYEDFVVNAADITATKEAEEEALAKLSRDTARVVKERMIERF